LFFENGESPASAGLSFSAVPPDKMGWQLTDIDLE
jgi:hypothetical protein